MRELICNRRRLRPRNIKFFQKVQVGGNPYLKRKILWSRPPRFCMDYSNAVIRARIASMEKEFFGGYAQ